MKRLTNTLFILVGVTSGLHTSMSPGQVQLHKPDITFDFYTD